MKRIFSLLMPLLTISCTNNTDTTGTKALLRDTAKPDTVRQVVNTLQVGLVTDLEFSKTITDRVDAACGGYFTYDTCKLADEKYIFIDDASDQAIIRFFGKRSGIG